MSEDKPKSSFARWYEANKDKLSEKRRLRYHQDPEYKARALSNSRQYRRTHSQRVVPPAEYSVNMETLLETLGITLWQFQEWRAKDYFPEPSKFGREIWFTQNQVSLLANLTKFLVTHRRPSREDRVQLQSIVQMIYANW